MATMSVSEVREYLGNLNSQLTDKQVEQIRDCIFQIAYFSLQEAKRQWNNQTKL